MVKVRMKEGTRGGADPENKEGHCASSSSLEDKL